MTTAALKTTITLKQRKAKDENRKSDQSLYLPPSVAINLRTQWAWMYYIAKVGFTVLLLPKIFLLSFFVGWFHSFRFLAKFGKVPLFFLFYAKPIFSFLVHSTYPFFCFITTRLGKYLLNWLTFCVKLCLDSVFILLPFFWVSKCSFWFLLKNLLFIYLFKFCPLFFCL